MNCKEGIFDPKMSKNMSYTEKVVGEFQDMSIGPNNNIITPNKDDTSPPAKDVKGEDVHHTGANAHKPVEPAWMRIKKALNWLLMFGANEHKLKKNEDRFFDLEEIFHVDHNVICSSTMTDVITMMKKLDQRFPVFQLGKYDTTTGKILVMKNFGDADINLKTDHLFLRFTFVSEKTGANIEPAMRQLLRILQHQAPQLNLTIHNWGFVNISEILKLNLKVFEGLSETDLAKCIDDFFPNAKDITDVITARRDPDKPHEVQIRATRGHSFPVVRDDGFGYQSPEERKLSKTLSFFLRHHTPVSYRNRYGYVELEYLKTQDNFKNYPNLDEDVFKLVQNSDGLERFHMVVNEYNLYEIRANYGHTFKVADVELEEITEADKFPTIVYGTNFKHWEEIKKTGIPRNTLSHIHLSYDAEHLKRCRFMYYSEYELLDVIIYIDLNKALKDGAKFHLTYNGVVLCRPWTADKKIIHENLATKYFLRAVNVATGEDMQLDPPDSSDSDNWRIGMKLSASAANKSSA